MEKKESKDKIKKSNIQEIHKEIYTYMKKTAHNLEGKTSLELNKYRKNQKRYARRPFELSNFEELMASIEKSHIVYIGDFHTFDQSSKNLERLLRTLENAPYEMAIGVEVVNQKHQQTIEQYLNNYITELEFLEMIDYHDSWRFPWHHYKSFFDLAKKKNLKILALNSEGNLQERDLVASNLICDFHQENPNTLLLVLFGEYHIAPNKLPKLVKDHFDRNFKHTIIHQNLDEVYFSKLLSENTNILGQTIKFNGSEFTLLTSPPWIKYESMIYWYENLCEDPEFEIHELINETGKISFNSTVPENFLFVCSKTLGAFNLKIDADILDNFNIYDYQKLDYIYNQLDHLPSKMSSLYHDMIKSGRSFRLPSTSNFYCSSYSLNRVSFLAGIHIFNLIHLKKDEEYERKLFESGNKVNIFLFFLYQSMSAYFSSKLLNPFRKCDLYLDFKNALLSKPTQIGTVGEVKLALDIIDSSNDLRQHVARKNLSTMFNSSRLVAYFMADIIFDKFISKNKNNFHEILNIIFSNHFELDHFLRLKNIVLPDMEYKKSKKRFF